MGDIAQSTAKFEVIIVGAGPGGLQLAFDLGRANIRYLLLERAESAGSSFCRLPVHRKLLSINKPHTGISDSQKNLRWGLELVDVGCAVALIQQV